MPEELKPIGGGMQPEGMAASEHSIGRQPEVGPSGIVEISPEKSAETANEKYHPEVLSKIPSQGPPTAAPEPQVEMDAKAVYDETDAEARVTKLVSLAETKGIGHAVKVAQKLDDFYVLDRMHDELSGKFYDALKAKGLIAE
jgi:hypothetical protein